MCPTVVLDVALGISLALGLLANVALICRFLERKPYQSTVVAIVALSVHDVINVITVTYFGVIHRFNDGFVSEIDRRVNSTLMPRIPDLR
jgi:potassium channel subfamily K